MTKSTKTNATTAREQLQALSLQHEQIEKDLTEARAALAEKESAVDELSYLTHTISRDEDSKALEVAEENAASLRARVRRLEAGLRGTAKREAEAQAAVDEEERQAVLGEIEAGMNEVSALARTVPARIEELAGVLQQIKDAQREANALAAKVGIRLPGTGIGWHTRNLLYGRLTGLVQDFGPQTGERAVKEAEQMLKAGWKR